MWNLDTYVRKQHFTFLVYKQALNRRTGRMAWRGVDYVSIVCEAGRMCVCFVMMHYSFSSGTHGKVFTKPSAEIAWLNWADVQLLRKWMLFKGANQCCTPVSVKGPSLSLSPSFFISLCLCVWSSSVTYYGQMWQVFLSQRIFTIISFFWFMPVCLLVFYISSANLYCSW